MALYPTLPLVKDVAEAFKNNKEQENLIPEGLSYGSPIDTTNVREGDTVMCLGSESGMGVFLFARKVGPTGSVIGLDMSEDMITAARKNAAMEGLKPPHVAFVKAFLTENLPIESNSVDCILSNPVANPVAKLLPLEGRASLFKEVNRILRPEGRVVWGDIIAKKPISDEMKNDIAVHPPGFSGAIIVEEYQSILKEAGLSSVVFVETYDINEWFGVYRIHAVKCGPPVDKPSTVLCRWWDAYPTAKSSPPFMTAEDIIVLKKNPAASTEFAVIDVRRDDHGGGHVRGSDNRAAQTFYDDLPAFYEKYKNTQKVIFYCSKSNGRGPRCAGWYQDYLDSQEDHNSTAYVLKGGVKNWLAQYGDHDDLVDRD